MDRDQLLTPMLLNQCYTFLLECSHSCKDYTSIITDRFLATKYPLRHESFPFYVDIFIPLSPTILLPGWTMWITWRVSWTKQEILNLHEHHGPQPLFDLVLVAHLFIFLCCVFFFVCLSSVSCAECCQCISCGRYRMVVGFTTTYAISAYHHWCCEFESRLRRGVQHYVIRFVNDLRQVGGFLRVLRFPLPIKLTARI
jgi:hypothetical protein